jgi:hypothetical protein
MIILLIVGENMNSKILNRKSAFIIVMILISITILIGISYALWSTRTSQLTSNSINSDCLKLEFTDKNTINLLNTYPLTDSEAKELIPYTFVVKNMCNVSVSYDVNLEIMDDQNKLDSQYIDLEINNNGKKRLNKYDEVTPTYKDKTYTAVEARNIISGVIDVNKSISYSIRIWMDESVTIEDDVMNKIFASKISVSASLNKITDAYTEDILNGTDPVISDYLIAVNIADDGTVTKADTTKKWYSYENKEWANAVILKDKTIDYENNAVIPEDNIESYFVWIPKYSYKLWNIENTSYTKISSWSDITIGSDKQETINIKFGTTNTDDSNSGECTTPVVSGESGNCAVGDYMTHPAFINANTNGLWVGKFETGYDGATTTSEAEVSSQDSTKIVIKPNVYSWRNNTVYNFFMASYNYNRNLDSHMMKNTEWGAVAYLSYSKYGINDEIWKNNNFNYVTGCVGSSVSSDIYKGCANSYNTITGYNGSTTGNISGIYDMNGGAWEYMAAYRENTLGSSGFDTTSVSTYAKYLDVYDALSSYAKYNYRILGDATGELGPFYNVNNSYYNNWFQDYSYFVYSVSPWFVRGSHYDYNSGAGQFAFGMFSGEAGSRRGTRLVLAI